MHAGETMHYIPCYNKPPGGARIYETGLLLHFIPV